MNLAFVIPGDINQRTGGYGYDRAILARFAAHGISAYHMPAPASFPFPSARDCDEVMARIAAVPPDHHLLWDGLAFGALPTSCVRAIHHPFYALVHHPLGLEAGLTPQQSAALLAQEQENLRYPRHIFVSSSFTAATLTRDFGVAPARITSAEPGTPRAERVMPRAQPACMNLLAVGSLIPRKAYHILFEALASVRHMSWRLTCVGALRDIGYVAQLRALSARYDLDAHIDLVGEYNEQQLEQAYAQCDIFISASLYEGYGMSLAEALVRGLPIIAAMGGAAALTLPDGAGLKIPPADVGALRDALLLFLGHDDLRHAYAERAWQAGREVPQWDDTAAKIAHVLIGKARA
jgi:Glycosyl transferases group 1